MTSLVRRVLGARGGALLLGLATAGLAAAGCAGPAASSDSPITVVDAGGDSGPFRGLELPDGPRPEFTLTDTSGAAYSFAERTAGHPTLLFFGYTRCPDICPTTLSSIARGIGQLEEPLAEQVTVVFVTTQPEHDRPEVVADYVARFDNRLPRDFVGLTGTVAEVEAAQRAAGVPVAEADGTRHGALVNAYGVDGRTHIAFTGGTSPDDFAQDLRLLAEADGDGEAG